MISRQQLRLLTLFVLAFGLLTVPVILFLIYLVPAEDANTVNAAVIQNQVVIDSPARIAPSANADREINTGSNANANYIENHQMQNTTERISSTSMLRTFMAGNWVVVDCGQRIVVQCPHRLLSTGTSPRFSKINPVFQSHCRDVSIKLDSFCGL